MGRKDRQSSRVLFEVEAQSTHGATSQDRSWKRCAADRAVGVRSFGNADDCSNGGLKDLTWAQRVKLANQESEKRAGRGPAPETN